LGGLNLVGDSLGLLLSSGFKDRGKEGNEVGLNTRGDSRVGGNGANGIKGTDANVAILLVGKLLLQSLDSPE
jgi:hypothetical protein